MDNTKFKIKDENGIEREAETITVFTYNEQNYIVFSISKDSENDNVYVSKLKKDENGYDTIIDIEDENERKEVQEKVKEILDAVK